MGRLNSRIHGQQVSLGGNLVDHRNHLLHILDADPNFLNNIVGLGNLLSTFTSYLGQLFARLLAVFGYPRHRLN